LAFENAKLSASGIAVDHSSFLILKAGSGSGPARGQVSRKLDKTKEFFSKAQFSIDIAPG
jgi:hypothetical protein